MAWSAPMTAVASSVFTAAQFNTFLRDNLNETAPAKATTAGGHFAVSDTNEISERVSATASVLMSETTTSTSYTDLATVGPTVTVETGPAALVAVHGAIDNSGAGSSRMSYAVSGVSTIAEADNRGIGVYGVAGAGIVASAVVLHTDLTPGINTFTAKYRVASGTGTFNSRRIVVFPL
ncbi:hypothetical protein [Streptomyces dubilierae]|uniref:Uncharacterized protein n=1 Tax=Streptomyces dubilierae TaxID=3075533 RepID=A0ABU2P7K2_9ACTN|nr:hypothetical protein [Streptomyces sp. DSM 41921]MDT0387802.1 hypothetical protein [Streptomyces sp. DSM 41921]